jgi:diguanylate cyclase (GGDEF)-like protein/PAS domain S-box-containing protein
MTGTEIAGVAMAVLAAVLAGVALLQRRELKRLTDGGEAAGVGWPPATVDSVERSVLRTLVTTVREPVLVHRERIEAANPAFCQLLGLPPEQVVGRSLAELVTPEYANLVANNLQRRLAGEPAPELTEIELADAHGQVTRLELRGTSLEVAGQRLTVYSAIDMLPAAAAAEPTATAAAPRMRAQLALESMAEGLVTTDAQGRIDAMNPAAATLLGVAADEAQGRPLTELVAFVDEHDRRPLPDPIRQCIASGLRVGLGRRALLLSRGGAEHHIELSAAPMRGSGGELTGVAAVLHDVTELRGLTRQMSYQASHDALTGLVNRREFERRLGEALAVSRAGRQSHVVCYLDLDRFKAVNDSCGHLAGDNMLREVATLLKDAVRDSDTVGRLGGDEFGILLIGCPLEKARQIADDLCRSVNEYRFVWKDQIFSIGVSVGLIEIGCESGELEDVMSAADSACYVAKRRDGSHVHVYSAHDEAVARHSGEIQWLQRLQSALRDGRFELYLQPIFAVREGGAAGPALEALLRMRDENGARIEPAEFMRAAERYRLMGLVDRWVVQTAFTALASGSIRLSPGSSLALNLSGQTLGDPAFLEFVVETLDHTGVPPSQVCFEVTETAVNANLDMARRFIGVLHGMGCQFALDDFGNDLGAFANLKSLEMDYIKIDGSYMRGLSHDAVNQAMVAAIVRLARTLKFRLVAEQVEDAATLETARGMGIDFAQGYVLGRPEPLRPGSRGGSGAPQNRGAGPRGGGRATGSASPRRLQVAEEVRLRVDDQRAVLAEGVVAFERLGEGVELRVLAVG